MAPEAMWRRQKQVWLSAGTGSAGRAGLRVSIAANAAVARRMDRVIGGLATHEGEVGPGWVMGGGCGYCLDLGGAEGGGGVTAGLSEPVVVEALHKAAGTLVADW